MKRFVYTILLFISIPLILLAGIYIWTDPFRCIHDFDVNDIDEVNREYLSTELFLRNEPTYHYNSFIFASSRGMALNTYQWKQYLPEGAQPFLFQAWSETLTGVELKIEYLMKHDVPIDNALILIDIPGSFNNNQLPTDAMAMKHYLFTGKSKLEYNAVLFWNFIQKPSFWLIYSNKAIKNNKVAFFSDTITNDFNHLNRFDFTEIPAQDSLNYCSEMTRRTFVETVNHLKDRNVKISKPLITSQYAQQMWHIRKLFEQFETNYHIIISPNYCYTNESINPNDLELLYEIFSKERVHNYSGENEWTTDYNNFADPNHFGRRVGYLIIEDIYKKNLLEP